MRKEVFLAIAIGFAVGIVITFGIWTANKSLNSMPQVAQDTPSPTTPVTAATTPSTTQTPTPTTAAGAISLVLSTPTDELLTDKSTVTVSGKTVPNAAVAILAEKTEYIVSADGSGAFTADVALDGGYNTITATAIDTEGKSSSQTITVTFSTAKI